jgi:hypothetical protein
MQVRYYAEDDTLILTATPGGRSGAALRDYFEVILTLADEGSELITRLTVLHATDFLPLDTDRSYDADTDTLTLGDKSDADCRVVENGDFVGYWQECDGGRYWDVVAVDLRRASVHLAPALAALPQPAPVSRV